MNFKKFACILLCGLFVFSAGCSKQKEDNTSDIAPVSSEEKVVIPEKVYINPLTGEEGLDPSKENTRPVAIMINNINIAQKVQCGLKDADIIYETEVEGGITRLLAVFQDVSKVGRIGTIRSARYPYIDIAMGHNAIYCHHGQDPNYAKAHLKDTTAFTVDTNNAGTRIKNGLSSEHTLYTNGDKLWETLSSKFDMKNNSSGTWLDFAEEDETVTLSGGTLNKISATYSNIQKTSFSYDAESGNYIYYSNGYPKVDYVTGEKIEIKNVFILKTSITNYPIEKYRKVDLSSGEGYYVTNGTYTMINWSKGSSKNQLTFTNSDGTPLKVSAGNSYIGFIDKYNGVVTIE